MNILLTNAGRRTYLIEYALELILENPEINLFVSDVSDQTAAMHVSKKITKIYTPRVSVNEEEYIEVLLQKCIDFKIDILIPLMDFELLPLARYKKRFDDVGVKVWVSSLEVIENCLDKRQNYFFCLENDIKIPKTGFKKQDINFPFIKKRILGSGSIGLEILETKKSYYFEENIDMLQELISGQEYGMDILNDYNGSYVHSCARKKISMRAGETDKAISVYEEKFIELAKKISTVFKHRGNMDVDFIVTDQDEIYFIDFNPRFGGGYPFTHLSGANYFKYIVESSFKNKPEAPIFRKSITGYKGLNIFVN